MHIALVGDSTLDNKAWTDGGPTVPDHLRAELGESHAVCLVAEDGDTTLNVSDQLRSVPKTATHIVLSVGGNDALQHLNLLERPVTTVREAMEELSDVLLSFERDYRGCLREVLKLDCPTIVCTVYNGAFPSSEQRAIECTVRLFDDVIIQAASDAGCPILDLRRICVEPSDFTAEIEPTAQGGLEIARALGEILLAGTPPGIYPRRSDAI